MQDGLLDPQTFELLYRTVLEPELWPSALANILPRFRSQHISLLSMDETPFFVHHGFTEDQLKVHFSPEAIRCWQKWRSTLPVEKTFTNRHVMSDREWQRSETYNEYIRHSGVYHGTIFNQDSGIPYSFAICRPGMNDPYSDEELKAIHLLNVHFGNTLRLQQRLNANRCRINMAQAALDRLNEGTLIVNMQGVPLLANLRAQEILDRGDGLMNGITGLRAHNSTVTQNLLNAIRAVSDRRWTGDLHLSLPRRKPRLPLMLDILSLSRLDIDTGGTGDASAVIFIKEPDAPFQANRQALADSLRFTPREVEIAALLAEGLNLDAIARKSEISIGTVRFHIKRIFQKTGVHSQAALVSLVRGFGAR